MRHLFVSDLHLDAAVPGAVSEFLQFLGDDARGAASLHVLGDLFETWIGDDDPDPVRNEICLALRALAESGTEVFVMQGNRDFLYGAQFERRSGATLIPDPVITTLCGERVLLTHGDLLCTGDHAYQELRSTLRDPGFRERVLTLPIDARQLLAASARAGSKAHTSKAALTIMDVTEQAVIAAFEATGVLKMIHGHTHRPGSHRYATRMGDAERVVLAAWDDGGEYLEITAAGWTRKRVSPQRAVPSESETPDRGT